MIDTEKLTLTDFTHVDVLSNPCPVYAELRRYDPVHFDPGATSWMITRFADAAAALGDCRSSAQRPSQGRSAVALTPMEQALSLQMLFLDPPSHTRLCGLFYESVYTISHGTSSAGDYNCRKLLDGAMERSEGDKVDFRARFGRTVSSHCDLQVAWHSC